MWHDGLALPSSRDRMSPSESGLNHPSVKPHCVAHFIFKVAHYKAHTQQHYSESITTLPRVATHHHLLPRPQADTLFFFFFFFSTQYSYSNWNRGLTRLEHLGVGIGAGTSRNSLFAQPLRIHFLHFLWPQSLLSCIPFHDEAQMGAFSPQGLMKATHTITDVRNDCVRLHGPKPHCVMSGIGPYSWRDYAGFWRDCTRENLIQKANDTSVAWLITSIVCKLWQKCLPSKVARRNFINTRSTQSCRGTILKSGGII